MKAMTNRLIHFTAAACAALTLVGTAHAIDTRSWDQKINDASTRFVVLAAFNSQAVLDKETQLVWERAPAIDKDTWGWARQTCAAKSIGGRAGWRLATLTELTSLVASTGLPTGHPFQMGGLIDTRLFWTATVNAKDVQSAWRVDFKGGSTLHAHYASHYQANPARAWCVRGGGPILSY